VSVSMLDVGILTWAWRYWGVGIGVQGVGDQAVT